LRRDVSQSDNAGRVRLVVRASDAETAIALLDTQTSSAKTTQMEIEALLLQRPFPKENWRSDKYSPELLSGVLLCLLYQWTNRIGTKPITTGNTINVGCIAMGSWVEFLEDRNRDGIWDYWVYYDEHGQVIRTECDNNFDGKPDELGRILTVN